MAYLAKFLELALEKANSVGWDWMGHRFLISFWVLNVGMEWF